MAVLLKKMGAHLYITLRERLLDIGVEDPLVMNALMSEMDYISDFHNGSTLIVEHSNKDTTCWVVEGALIDLEDREDGLL